MRLARLLPLFVAFSSILASAQLQGDPTPAPAPGPAPEAEAPASVGLPASQIPSGPIDGVSTPVLAALVPIAKNVRSDAETGVKQVESGVDDIKADWPGIEASFKGRKLLGLNTQDLRGKRMRAAAMDGKPSLKRLQTKLEEKAQTAAAAAAAAAQTEAGAASNDTAIVEDEDALIEKDLVKMKEDRLKAIQALPRSVWS